MVKRNCIDEWKVRIYWNKVAGASGYQVYRKKKGADSWKLYKTVSSKYNYATNYLEGIQNILSGSGRSEPTEL